MVDNKTESNTSQTNISNFLNDPDRRAAVRECFCAATDRATELRYDDGLFVLELAALLIAFAADACCMPRAAAMEVVRGMTVAEP